MTEIDILKSIAENLSERKSSAALNNYEILCNNIKYVNGLLSDGVVSLTRLQNALENAFQQDDNVSKNLKSDLDECYYFRKIIPRILLNDINIIRKFVHYTKPDNRDGITVGTVNNLRKDFLDYNNLVTASRQFIDSLVSNAYQLIILEPKEINFQVLTSLLSFSKYATKSIKHALFNPSIQNALTEFEKLGYNERNKGKPSAITKCDKKSFGEKVDFLFDNLNMSTAIDFKEEIKNLFHFSSEFTHIGYVSTFFTSSNGSEIIFGDDISPYLLSTENFNELKYEVLETATKFFAMVYLPSVEIMLKKTLEKNVSPKFEMMINIVISNIIACLNTRNNEYFFFIREGLISSSEIIDLPCLCGNINHWNPPHDLEKLYCNKCGSKLRLIEVKGDPGYIVTSNGPAKVIGSKVPDFSELPLEKKLELLKQCDKISRECNKADNMDNKS